MQRCEWCLHDWHEGECWCYCLEATTYPEPEICDKCGTPIGEVGTFVLFEKLPVGFTAYDGLRFETGEPNIWMCNDCHVSLGVDNA